MARYIYVIGMAGLILLTGCTTLSKPAKVHMPADIPGSWRSIVSVRQLPITSNLLDLIDDERLEGFVQESLDNNPDLTATALRLKAAGYFLSGPRSRMLPKVNAGFDGGRNNQSVEHQTGARRTENSHRLSLAVNWELDLWGRLADEYSAANYEYRAQENDYLFARNALAVWVIQAWIEQVAIRRSLAVERERVAVLQRIEDFLIERYRNGVGNIDELSTARSRTEIAKADLSDRTSAWRRSIRRLEILLGHYPGGNLEAGEDLPSVLFPPVDIPARVLLNRPDIRAALARAESARHTAKASQKAMLPDIRLSAQIFKQSARLTSVGNATTYWEILGTVFQPVFEGGRLRDESRGRLSEAEATIMDLHAVVLRAMKEVEDALDQIANWPSRSKLSKSALRSPEKASSTSTSGTYRASIPSRPLSSHRSRRWRCASA